MYQQQVEGIMSATGLPLAFPPRKGSLPCSVSSSILDDITTPRGPQFVHQQPSAQGQISYLSANTALPVRTRPRAPSHLSNMVNHADGSIANTEVIQTAGSDSFPPKRGHVRSQSQGSRTTGNRGSAWDQLGALKDAQAGYATLIDIPTTTSSQMGYQIEDDDDDFMLRESVRMSIKAGMSLKEALAIDNLMYRSSMQQPQQTQHVLAPSFNGEIDDKMVHPLDLSPLLLQTRSGPQHQQTYGHPAGPSPDTRGTESPAAAAQLAWDETCVGLGLTMDTTPSQYQEPQQNNNHQASIEDYSLPRRPIPVRHHHFDRSDSNTYQQQRRPDMATKSTVSELTTHTFQSDATLNSGSHHYQPQQPVQRQPSQRNKKNLVVNITPSSQQMY
ncbi:hypothetical protein BGX24_003491 [Mortierella sp. AD032]|nr:hypothetical protein BGX24_003491 [Mortierella sp. AD032]